MKTIQEHYELNGRPFLRQTGNSVSHAKQAAADLVHAMTGDDVDTAFKTKMQEPYRQALAILSYAPTLDMVDQFWRSVAVALST